LIHRAGCARGQDLKKKIPLLISWKSLNPKYQMAAEPGNVTNGGTIGAGRVQWVVKRAAAALHGEAGWRDAYAALRRRDMEKG
jgi:hypothetical protein